MGYKINFNFDNLKEMYQNYKERYGNEAYKYISNLLIEAKELHREAFMESDEAQRRISHGQQIDHEQSWRAFKGKNLEKLILFMLEVEVENLGLKVINGNHLERALPRNLSYEESQIKRKLSVDFGEFGLHLPDVDLVIYIPETLRILAVLSSKVTLRERIAQDRILET